MPSYTKKELDRLRQQLETMYECLGGENQITTTVKDEFQRAQIDIQQTIMNIKNQLQRLKQMSQTKDYDRIEYHKVQKNIQQQIEQCDKNIQLMNQQLKKQKTKKNIQQSERKQDIVQKFQEIINSLKQQFRPDIEMVPQRKYVINLKELKQSIENKKKDKNSLISFETDPEDEISFLENEEDSQMLREWDQKDQQLDDKLDVVIDYLDEINQLAIQQREDLQIRDELVKRAQKKVLKIEEMISKQQKDMNQILTKLRKPQKLFTLQNNENDLAFKDVLAPYCFKIQPLKKIYYKNKGIIGKSQNEVIALENNKVVKVIKMQIGQNKKQFAEKVLENLMEIITMKDIELAIQKNHEKMTDLSLQFHKIENCFYDNDIQDKQFTFYIEQNLLSGNLDLAINFGQNIQNLPFCWLIETWISLLKNLELIHRIGYGHFDVKGSNVSFINKDPFKPIFIDFQYAKKISEQDYMNENERIGYFTKIQQIMGTTHHIAPEIWTHNYYGFQSDYYSFGIMMLKSLGFIMDDFLDQLGKNIVINNNFIQNLITKNIQRILRFFPQNTNSQQIQEIVQNLINLIQNLTGSENRFYYTDTLNALNNIKNLNLNLNQNEIYNCQNKRQITQLFINKLRGK